MRAPRILFPALFCFVLTPALAGPVDPVNFSESVYVSTPLLAMTGIDWAPDGSNRLFILRKGGFSGIQTAEVRVVQNGALLAAPFATESVHTDAESGLIGICFDPNFSNNHFVYFFITVSTSQQQIIRYTDTNNVGTNRTVIVGNLPTAGSIHNGGALGFGNDGKLYWAIGDNGNGSGINSDRTSLASKVGRATRTGGIPNDNPFFDGAGPNNDYIWSAGYRNPFTFTFQRTTGTLWLNVVGTLWEQIFTPGRGFFAGWNAYENNQPTGVLPPVIAYKTNGTESRTIAANGAVRSNGVVTFTTTSTHPFRKGGLVTISGVSNASFNGTFPVESLLPGSPDPQLTTKFTVVQAGANATSGGGTATTQNIGGAATGGCFYDSTAFPAAFRGNFFFGDYVSGRIMRVQLDGTNRVSRIDEFFTGSDQRIDMATGPDGALYLCDQTTNTIKRVAYTGTQQNLILQPTAFNVLEGGSSIVSVRLNSAPASNITVTTSRLSGDSDLSVSSGSSLVFTPANYNVSQKITIAAAEDADQENDSAVFRVLAPGIATYDLTVNGIDNDEPQLVVSRVSVDGSEGGTNTFTVRLANAPAVNVSVSVARTSGDTGITVSGGSSLTFTPANFATPQTVTLSFAEDPDNVDDTATITVSASGETPRNVAVKVTDNDQLAPSITTSPILTAVVGAAYTYDVNANGNPAPTFSLTTAPPVSAGTMSINPSTGIINWTPTTTGTFAVAVKASNGVLPDATQSFNVTVNADMPPTAVLTKPVAGDVVSGTNAEFFGDGVDDVSTVKAEFFVDGVLRYTDVNNQNHFHYGGAHNLFNTTQFNYGTHTLGFRVTDTKGQTNQKDVQITIGSGGTSPPLPQSAVARDIHGQSGILDINLPLTGTPGIECRSGGPSGDYEMIVTFSSAVTVNGNFQADVTTGIGDIGTNGVSNGGVVSVNGAVVTVPLTNVANAQHIRVTLFDVHQGANAGDVTIPMSVLIGDTSGNGVVNSSDVSQTKAQSGTAAASRRDVTVNGVINSSDVSLVQSKSGTALPP